MDNITDNLLNIFFFTLHASLIIFNMTGWLFDSTRKFHLFTLILTLGSWVIGGFFFGFGYCFLTDWHYRVLERQGYENLPASFINLILEKFFGIYISGQAADILTVTVFTVAFTLSVYLIFLKNK